MASRQQARQQFAALFGETVPTEQQDQNPNDQKAAVRARPLREDLGMKIRDVIRLLDVPEICAWVGKDEANFYKAVVLMMNRSSHDALSMKDAADLFKMDEDDVREKLLQIETQILTRALHLGQLDKTKKIGVLGRRELLEYLNSTDGAGILTPFEKQFYSDLVHRNFTREELAKRAGLIEDNLDNYVQELDAKILVFHRPTKLRDAVIVTDAPHQDDIDHLEEEQVIAMTGGAFIGGGIYGRFKTGEGSTFQYRKLKAFTTGPKYTSGRYEGIHNASEDDYGEEGEV